MNRSHTTLQFYEVGQSVLTRIVWVILILIPTFWLAACSVKEEPPQPLLIFEHRIDGKSQIYTARPDGSQQTLITEFPSANRYWLSPNGKYLAFHAFDEQDKSHHLKIIDPATGAMLEDLPRVAQTWSEHIPWEENAVWSPQGDKLVFLRSSEYGKEPDIFLYDLSTKAETQLTNTEAVERSAAWSPDGQQIVYTSWNGCAQSDCLPEELYWSITVMDSDGSNKRVVTNFHGLERLPADLWLASLCHLTWSPDAAYIAFENECGALMAPYYWKEVFVASVDGSEVRRLTTFTDAHDLSSNTLAERAFGYSVHWSSDSNTLFIGYSNVILMPEGKSYGGILMTSNNAVLSPYLQDSENIIGSSAKWSPDNGYVAWYTRSVNRERWYRVPEPISMGKIENDQVSMLFPNEEDLPIGPCNSLEIYWSPNSKFVAYIANEPETSCNDTDTDQKIAVVSVPDKVITYIAESLPGDIELLGWTYEFHK